MDALYIKLGEGYFDKGILYDKTIFDTGTDRKLQV